jgi:hypothetical protein
MTSTAFATTSTALAMTSVSTLIGLGVLRAARLYNNKPVALISWNSVEYMRSARHL